jgi:hypothetical protein
MEADDLIERRNRLGTVYFENRKGEIISKVCTKCKRLYLLEFFNKSSQGIGKKSSHCKQCIAEDGKEYYKRNLDSIKQKYLNKRDHHLEQKRKWYRKNIEKTKRYRIINEEKTRLFMREWRIKNREHIKQYSKKYIKENSDKRVLFEQKRRARKKSLPSNFTVEQQKEILGFFGGCALTGNTNVTWDHVIPLSTGYGGTVFGNMIPLISRLNSSKNDSNIFEWFESNRQRFNLSNEKFETLISWLSSANAMTEEEYRKYVYFCHCNPYPVERRTN